MKKISLKSVSDFLSDKQMKSVVGGYGGSFVRCWSEQEQRVICFQCGIHTDYYYWLGVQFAYYVDIPCDECQAGLIYIGSGC